MEAEYLTPYQIYHRWAGAISLKTMANWRSLGVGPPYVKVRGRVLYPRARLLEWEATNGSHPSSYKRAS
jgi:hypothetical protein